MCSIFGSATKDEFFELAELNGYRGAHSHSIATYDLLSCELKILEQDFGPVTKRDLPEGKFYIGHQQAPTTDAKDKQSIHPARHANSYLWHNGIIKDHQIKQWQLQENNVEPWDTKWILMKLLREGTDTLSNVDGSFACLWSRKEFLYLFRNDNCPMFIEGSTFSSTKFPGSSSIAPGQFYLLQNASKWTIMDNMRFKTKEQFYWSFEE